MAREETTDAERIQDLGMSKGATLKVVSRLKDKGLVGRQLADGQARKQSLGLTVTGNALVPQLAALADVTDAQFFGHRSAAELKVLGHAMQDLVCWHRSKTEPGVYSPC